MATHSSVLAWRTPMDRGAWRAIVHRVAETVTQLKSFRARAILQIRKQLRLRKAVNLSLITQLPCGEFIYAQ